MYAFVENYPTFYVDILGNSKRPAPKNQEGGRIPPANRPRDNFNSMPPSRPITLPPSSGKTGSVMDAVGEAISIYDYIAGNSPEEVARACVQTCNQYVSNRQLKQGCSCCQCSYNTRIARWGNLQRINYSLYSIRITPNVTCEVKGWIPVETLFQAPGKPSIAVDPWSGKPYGRLHDDFNV